MNFPLAAGIRVFRGAFLLFIILSFSPVVLGADSPRGLLNEHLLIGYVDFNRALNDVSDGRAAKQRLKREFNEKQQQLDRLQSELKVLRDGLEKERLFLSPEELKKREEDYQERFLQLQQMLAVFKGAMATREAHLTEEILKRLKEIVQDIGRREGYSLILERSQEVILFAPDANDLTERVIREYDGAGRPGKKRK